MKKKALFIAVGLSIIMLAGGCSTKKDLYKDSNTNTTVTPAAATAAPTTSAAPTPAAKPDYVVDDYITLGQYKGVEIDKVEITAVTDDAVTDKINSDLESDSTTEEITDRKDVQDGDIVNIDYEGLKDGVAFDNGTAAGQDLTIGSGQFIPGFEEQLIGDKVGDKVEINLTFPEDYSNAPELAGQPVVFKVTINSIKKKVVPELNEEYVTKNTTYKTVDEYKEGVRADLKKENEEDAKNKKTDNVLKAIVANSKITYPQELLDYYLAQVESYYTQMASYYQMDLTNFLSAVGMTEDNLKTYAESMASQELITKAVINAEKMELTDKEYNDGVTDLATRLGYSSSEEFLTNAAESDIKDSLLQQKAIDFIVEQAVEK